MGIFFYNYTAYLISRARTNGCGNSILLLFGIHSSRTIDSPSHENARARFVKRSKYRWYIGLHIPGRRLLLLKDAAPLTPACTMPCIPLQHHDSSPFGKMHLKPARSSMKRSLHQLSSKRSSCGGRSLLRSVNITMSLMARGCSRL